LIYHEKKQARKREVEAECIWRRRRAREEKNSKVIGLFSIVECVVRLQKCFSDYRLRPMAARKGGEKSKKATEDPIFICET
jgi:hypothetical protein